MDEKPLLFCGSSRDDLRAFPDDARAEAGGQLYAVQLGFEPANFKYMKTIGAGTYEIRIHADDGQYRVFYVAKFQEAIYVLHAFQKKTRKTPKADIDKARARYGTLLRERVIEQPT